LLLVFHVELTSYMCVSYCVWHFLLICHGASTWICRGPSYPIFKTYFVIIFSCTSRFPKFKLKITEKKSEILHCDFCRNIVARLRILDKIWCQLICIWFIFLKMLKWAMILFNPLKPKLI
jgi:hypothetical protein